MRIEEAGDKESSDEEYLRLEAGDCRLQTADPHNLLHPLLTIRSDRIDACLALQDSGDSSRTL